MRKLLLISVVCLCVFAGAVPGLAAGGGFVMTGAEAAYAQFDDGICHLEVRYVWARQVKYFSGELVRPHSDLEVELAGLSCPLDGKLGLVNLREMPPMIGSLEWADIDAVVIDDVDVEATVDLYWTAVGDVYNEFFSEPGQRAAHRTRDATVTGTVTIDGYGEFTVDDLQAAVITRYNEIQRDNLR